MYAAVLHGSGETPRYATFAEPSAGEGEAIVHVTAAALKQVEKAMAEGSHYASYRTFPVVCGVDGAGRTDDGTRVFFAGPRAPFGGMAERTVVAKARLFPIPDSIGDATAAALINPGMSAWLSLSWRAQLAAGETVMILGATGVTGKLAVRIARILGAGKIIAAGRNEGSLRALNADAIVRLDQSDGEVTESFAQAGPTDVVIDYLWGRPTELLIAAMAQSGFGAKSKRTRLVEVGESAGSTVSLPAASLRSSGLEIMGAGSGYMPGMATFLEIRDKLLEYAAKGELKIDTRIVPLSEVAEAWGRNQSGVRLVMTP